MKHKNKCIHGGERSLTGIGKNVSDKITTATSINDIVDKFIKFLDDYNNLVDKENNELFNSLIDNKNTTSQKGGTIIITAEQEKEKENKINELLGRQDIEEAFNLIKLKTNLYWYDYIPITGDEKQSFLKIF